MNTNVHRLHSLNNMVILMKHDTKELHGWDDEKVYF